jgi:hypothetical protein
MLPVVFILAGLVVLVSYDSPEQASPEIERPKDAEQNMRID